MPQLCPILKWRLCFILLIRRLIGVDRPLLIRALLIIYSLLVRIRVSFYYSTWLFYRIILIFLGGIIVVIIYVCTLRENDKFRFEVRIDLILIGVFIVAGIYIIQGEEYIEFAGAVRVGGLFKPIFSGTLIFLVAYLLIILFLVVKFSESFKGAIIKLD